MIVQERYQPAIVGVNSTYVINGQNLGGFLAVTAGTITVTTANGTAVLSAFPVSAGVYYPLPFFMGQTGSTLVTAGGASGTVLV